MKFPKPVRVVDEEFKRRIRKLPCMACGGDPPSTVSHIKTRGSGGSDQWFNVCSMCLTCHRRWGTIGASRFCDEFPHFMEFIEKLGWYFEGAYLRHPEFHSSGGMPS